MAAMCCRFALIGLLLLAGPSTANPIEKVIGMISDLEAKVTKAGAAEDKAFKEFFDWCDDAAGEAKFAIKTATSEKNKAEATIVDSSATIEASTTEISDLAGSISQAEAELAAASDVRAKEHADFSKEEAELVEGVGMLDKAITTLEKEMSKNPALMQTKAESMQGLISALSVVLDAAAFSTTDHSKLVAFVQSQSQSDDMELGAPAAAAYKSQSSGITDVLEDMKEKAEGELADARKAESASLHNFEMLKQSLTDQVGADTKDMNDSKAAKSAAEGAKGGAQGDLTAAKADLANSDQVLATTSSDCMTVAADHETSLKGRAEELEALATAKKIVIEATSGAAASLFQVSAGVNSGADLAKLEVVTAVKKLAKEQHSAALAQLASRIQAVVRLGASSGDDPFVKIRGLITDMIAKLQKEAAEAADKKEYCDEEMSKNAAKKEELTGDIGKLTAKVDVRSARSAEAKSEVAELQKELAALASLTAEMNKIRGDENAAYVEASSDLKQGITGVQAALGVLRDYYSSAAFVQQPAKPVTHSASGSAGSGIISMLEVAESDMSKNLAQIEMEEASSANDYATQTQQNVMTKKMKDSDVKYKSAEAKGLDKEVAELSGDRAGLQTELDAVLEYGTKLTGQCVAVPMSYEERKARREAEINGLKQALEILESETAFLQKPRRLRSVSAH